MSSLAVRCISPTDIGLFDPKLRDPKASGNVRDYVVTTTGCMVYADVKCFVNRLKTLMPYYRYDIGAFAPLLLRGRATEWWANLSQEDRSNILSNQNAELFCDLLWNATEFSEVRSYDPFPSA